MPLYVNDLKLTAARTLSPGTSFLTANLGIPNKQWSSGNKLGTDQKKLSLEVVVGTYAEVEAVRGVLEENDVVVLHSTNQYLFDAERTVYAYAANVDVEEEAPGYILVKAEMILVGTPSTTQPQYQLSSRQLDNWHSLVGRTVIGLPGTAQVPSSGTVEARGNGIVVITPSWASDATYKADEVKLGEVTYEIDFEDTELAIDRSTNGNHGLGVGTLKPYEDDAWSGTRFDGVSTHVEILHADSFAFFTDKLTLTARAMVTDFGAGTDRYLIHKSDLLRVYVKQGGILGVDIHTGGDWVTLTTPASTLRLGVMHAIGARYDGAKLSLWVDGSKVNESDVAGLLTGGTSNLYIASDGDSDYFAGVAQDVRLHKVALPDASMTKLARSQRIDQTGLVGHWPLDVYAGSLWRNAVRLYDGDPNDPANQVRGSGHKFEGNVWLTSDQYQLGIIRDSTSPDYRRIVINDAQGLMVEKLPIANLNQVYALRITDDYTAVRLNTGHVIELWRGKDFAIQPPDGELEYLIALAPSVPQTPDADKNYTQLGTDFYVASNRDFELTTDLRIAAAELVSDQKFWFIRASSLAIDGRAIEALKKLG